MYFISKICQNVIYSKSLERTENCNDIDVLNCRKDVMMEKYSIKRSRFEKEIDRLIVDLKKLKR